MNPIVVEALLTTGEGESVRLILGPYCLDVEADDVMALEEMPLPPGVTEGSAIAGRLILKPGARLLRIGSAEPCRKVIWSRAVPFALATRPTAIFEVDVVMKERERAFFEARGLAEQFS